MRIYLSGADTIHPTVLKRVRKKLHGMTTAYDCIKAKKPQKRWLRFVRITKGLKNELEERANQGQK